MKMKNRIYFINGITALLLLFCQLAGGELNASPLTKPVSFSNYKTTDASTLADTTRLTICNNQLPYSWNGLAILREGVYSALLTGSNGQDSLVFLDLHVIDVGTSITNAVICNNQLPYQWNGLSINSSGTYSVTLTSANGCDSVPILSLTVNNVVTSTTVVSVCRNEVPFRWNGNSYNASGNYNITLTSSGNCDSIANLILTVRDTTTSTTTVATCANRLPFNWNGSTYSAAGNYQVRLTGRNGCDSVAKLSLAVNPVATSLFRLSICADDAPFLWNGRSLVSSGTYRQTLISASGCDSIATLILTIRPALQSQTNRTICVAQLPYTWNGNTYSSGGNYSVTLPSSNGCDSTARLRLTVTDILRDTLNQVVCISDLPFRWNGNNYTLPGIYSANFVTSAGCDSVATLNLSLDNPSVIADSLEICPNQLPFNYNGQIFNAGGIYNLSPPVVIDACHSINVLNLVVKEVIPGNTRATVCSNYLPFIWNGVAFDSAGTYTKSLTSSTGCDSLDVLHLTVLDTTFSVTDTTVCSSQLPFIWNGNLYTNSGEYRDTILSNSRCDSIAIVRLTIKPSTRDTTEISICPLQLPYSWNGAVFNSAGTHRIDLTGTNGCDSTKILILRVSNVIQTTEDRTVCFDDLPFVWNGQPYDSTGTYTIQLQNSAGCDSIATLNLLVYDNLGSTTTVATCVSQLPFHWNGIDYVSSGSYSATLVNETGCDSVAILNLTVTNQLSSETSITICNNQLPYSWNGNSYAVAGNYVVNLTSSTGCDSLAILHLLVTDILTSTTNVTVCPAQLPYQWNGNFYSQEGTYAITMSTPNGCDSVPILSLTVAPFVTSLTQLTVCESNLPFRWNGQSFTSAGSHTVNLLTVNGCDSIATLQLNITPTDSSETRVSVCENALPYSWNGNLFSSTGSYQKIFQTSSGCDSVAILHLTVNAIDTTITTVTVCSNLLPYRWNGQTITSAGEYFFNFTGSAGCDSVATLRLAINETSFSSQQVEICNLQLPYLWSGLTITGAGIYRDTLQNIMGCDSIVQLELQVNPDVNVQLNADVCSNELPYIWNGQTINSSGNYSARFVNAAGCDSIVRLTLTVNPAVTSSTAISMCRASLPFVWNGITINSSGNFTAALHTMTGCDSIASLHLTVTEASSGSSNATICSADLPFLWNGRNISNTGTYRDTLRNQAGCDSILTLNLTVIPSPGPVNIPPPLTYCQFEQASPLLATADGNASLMWYTNATGGPGSAAAPVPSTNIAGISTFYVGALRGACEGPRTAITVRVNRKPDLGEDKSLALCFGQSGNLTDLFNTDGLDPQWTFNGAAVSPLAVDLPGTYSVVVQNTEGCGDTALVNFAVNPRVIADAGTDADVETGVPYRLEGNGNGSFAWSPSSVLNNAGIANPVVTIRSNTTLVLTVTDNLGCVATDTVHLRVLNGPTFYVPSAFTPNGDGLNDVFRPTPVGIQKLDYFRVFNRYGELVFETSEIGKGWNGIYKGVQQNGGNYVWAVKGIDRTGRERMMKGNVVLIR